MASNALETTSTSRSSTADLKQQPSTHQRSAEQCYEESKPNADEKETLFAFRFYEYSTATQCSQSFLVREQLHKRGFPVQSLLG